MPTIPETTNVENVTNNSSLGFGEAAINHPKSLVKANVAETKTRSPRSSKAKAAKKGKKTMKTTNSKLSKNGKPAAKKNVIKCMCGCGSPTGNRFAPGHDACLKSKMLKAHRSDKGLSGKMQAMVKELGWSKLITK